MGGYYYIVLDNQLIFPYHKINDRKLHNLSRPKMPISKGKMTAKKMAIPKKTFSVICAKSCESSSSPIFDRFCSKLMCLEERNKTKRVARVLRGRTKSIHAVQHPVLFAHQNFKKFLANGQRQRVIRFGL